MTRPSDRAIAQAFYEQYQESLRAGIKAHMGFWDGVFAKAKRIDAREPASAPGPATAPWPDFKGHPIRHGDHMQHPDGMAFTAIKVPGSDDPQDAWRAVYVCHNGPSHVSRLGLQIGDKGQAFVIDAAAPEGAPESAREFYGWVITGPNGSMFVPQSHPLANDLVAATPQGGATCTTVPIYTAPPSLDAEDAALREDAERYRWLRNAPNNAPDGGVEILFWRREKGAIVTGASLDAAIDAARAAEGKGHG